MTTKHIYLGATKVASKTGDKLLYYHPDHLGSSNVISDKDGNQVQLSEYKPYGELNKNTATLTNYYFTGKELDSTGLYYYGARYYDAIIGRFITADPLQFDDPNLSELTGKTQEEFLFNPQNFNRYAYCLNNPLRYIDPTGYYSREEFNQDFNRLLYNLNIGINWASYNIIQPINNTFYSPGYNYGQWIYGEKNLRSLYGASLDATWAITGVQGAFSIGETVYYNLTGSRFWRYIGDKSLPLEQSGWVTRSSSAPYGTDFSTAMNRLSAPPNNPWNAVESVNIPWNQYVGGPRIAAPKVTWGTSGMGAEYRIGGFGIRNWTQYIKDWTRYILDKLF